MLQSKFVLYIKFNGCLIVLLVGFFVVVSAHRWLMQMQNWSAYPFVAGLELRNHPVVDGVFQIVWITAVASLYQALWLEVELLLYPIGFMLGLEVLLVAAGDVIKRWNDEAEDCFLRRGQDGVVWIALLAYFYYTLYILKQLFRTKNRKSSVPPGATRYPLVSVQMDPKFVYFIKLNSYIVVSMIVIHVRDVVQRQSGQQYPLAEWLKLRNHPFVEDVFNRYWKFAEFTHLLGVLLEIDHFLIPIGFIFGLEVLTVAAEDVIWNDIGENYQFLLALIIWFEDAEADEEDGQNGRSDERGDRGDRGDLNGEKEKLDEEHSLRDDGSPEPPNGEIVSILRKNGSLLQSQEISSSQQNFFRMLDQKIEEGPDYDSSSETEQALEEARLNALVQHWESASLTTSMCSSTSRSLQGTPVRQVPLRQPPLRPPFQQPLSAELLSQQQLLLKQQHHHLQQQHQQQQHLQQQQQLIQHQQQQLHNLQQQQQQQHGLHQQAQGSQSQQPQMHHPNLSIGMNSPKRIIASGNAVSMGGGGVDGGPPSQRQLLSQSIIHQNYGVIQPSQTTPQLRPSSGRTLPSPVQCLQMSYYQQQQQQQQQSQQQQQQQAQSLSQQFQQQQSLPPHSTTSYYNDILRHPMQLPPVTQLQLQQQLQSQAQQQPVQQQQQQQSPMPAGISNVSSSVAASLASASVAVASASGPSGGPSGAVGGPLSMSSTEPRFPPAIAVQRLAPQVQRQLRETQELIKDSCVQLYGSAYGTGPGPPTGGGGGGGGSGGVGGPVGSVLARATARRPTLETQYSQELS